MHTRYLACGASMLVGSPKTRESDTTPESAAPSAPRALSLLSAHTATAVEAKVAALTPFMKSTAWRDKAHRRTPLSSSDTEDSADVERPAPNSCSRLTVTGCSPPPGRRERIHVGDETREATWLGPRHATHHAARSPAAVRIPARPFFIPLAVIYQRVSFSTCNNLSQSESTCF